MIPFAAIPDQGFTVYILDEIVLIEITRPTNSITLLLMHRKDFDTVEELRVLVNY